MKRIVSLLISLIIAMSFMPSAYAESVGYTFNIMNLSTYSSDDGYYSVVSVQNPTSSTKTGVLVVVYYSSDGKFLDSSSTEISVPPTSSNMGYAFSVKFDSKPTIFQKAFIFDGIGTFTPLAESCTLPVNYAIALDLGNEDNEIWLLPFGKGGQLYEVDLAKATNFTADFVTDKIDDEIYVADRFVAYTVTDGKIDNICKVTPSVTITATKYDAETSQLGSGNKILDTTQIFYIEDAEGTIKTGYSGRYDLLSKNDLIDGIKYTGHIYKIDTDVAFAIFTEIEKKLGQDSRFAVAIENPKDYLNEDGDYVKGVKALYDGEIQDLYFVKTGSTSVADSLTLGNIFFFTTNSDGYVDAIYTPIESDPVWEDKIFIEDWSYNIWDENKTIQFAQGVVTEVTSNGVSFATIEQVESGSLDTNLDLDDTHTDGIVTYLFADDCVAYTYDSTMKSRIEADKYDVTSPSSIKASDFSSFDNGNGVLNDGFYSGDLMSKATTATAMIVDGEVVAIFAYERS